MMWPRVMEVVGTVSTGLMGLASLVYIVGDSKLIGRMWMDVYKQNKQLKKQLRELEDEDDPAS